MSAPTDVVILHGARTPQGRIMGQLAPLSAVRLGAHAIRAALERAGVEPTQVDQVLMGQVIQAGAGQNPAKQAAMAAGISRSVPAMTLNKVCLSGLAAVVDAARPIRLGEADVMVAGGQESMTGAPHLAAGHHHVGLAQSDRPGGVDDGGQPGQAHLVQGHGGHGAGDARGHRGLLGGILPGPGLDHLPHEHLVHLC
ncbi:hypothetical protein SA15R_03590, partial [Rothia kristinae]